MDYKRVNIDELKTLDDTSVLKLRFKDLSLNIEGTEIEDYVKQLYFELEAKGLKFRPDVFLGDEWFSPEGMNAISVPFYLVNDRLKLLEKNMMLEVEGENHDWFMKLLRHEAGHCFDHCYKFSKRPKWKKIFGSPDIDYNPETYRPHPFSKGFVRHLDRWYAQAHPDEDFAETFAVLLDPDCNWKKVYAKWPGALEKLNYVESLIQESAKLKINAEKGRLPSAVKSLTSTLAKYYQKRKIENAEDYPDFYDSDLKKIFNGDSQLSKKEFSAGKFMHKYRKLIVNSVAWATGEKKYTIDSLVKRLTDRCEKLELRIGKTQNETTIEVASLLTSLVKNYLFTGKFKREV